MSEREPDETGTRAADDGGPVRVRSNGRPVGTRRVPKFRRRADARPDEVLDAALKLFVDKGFAATRVEDIARAAGLSKGAVYLYFPSKEAVIEAIVRRTLMPLARETAGAVLGAGDDPEQAIRLALTMFAQRLGSPEFLAVPKMVMREVVQFPVLAELYRKQVIEVGLPMLTGLIAHGVQSGRFRKIDPELAARSVAGPIVLHVMLSEIFGVRPATGFRIADLVQTHLTILFEGLRAPEKA